MKKGFTLIELLTVVMILAVLSAVAVPQYRRSVERARLAEGVQMLPVIYDAVDRYYVSLPAPVQDVQENFLPLNPGQVRCMALQCRKFTDVMVTEAATKWNQKDLLEEEVRDVAVTKIPAEAAAIDFGTKEVLDEGVTFGKLDLNLKGNGDGRVWHTPNFTYEIAPRAELADFAVAARLEKGKYKGTVLGYDGEEIYCFDDSANVPGACALVNFSKAKKVKPIRDFGPISEVKKDPIEKAPIEEAETFKDVARVQYKALK